MINHDFYTFITNGNFSDYNISVYEKDHNISDKQLLKNSFKFLFSYIPNKLKNNEFSINITINTINLICILFLSNNFDNEEIIVNKKRIATAKKMMISFLKKNINQKLLDAMNKIDSIILDKEININDLVKLIKELIDRKEYDAIISKIIKINKEVLDHNNCELFDIVFDKTINSIKNDDNDAYYYISLLKILYTNKINKDYYIFKIDEICNHNLFYRELYSIINGKMVCLKENEILEKYFKNDEVFVLSTSKKLNTTEKVFDVLLTGGDYSLIKNASDLSPYYLIKRKNVKLLVNTSKWKLKIIELPHDVNENKFTYDNTIFKKVNKLIL